MACYLVPVGPLTAMHFPDDYIIAAMGQPSPLHFIKILDLYSHDLSLNLTAGGPAGCFAGTGIKPCAHSED